MSRFAPSSLARELRRARLSLLLPLALVALCLLSAVKSSRAAASSGPELAVPTARDGGAARDGAGERPGEDRDEQPAKATGAAPCVACLPAAKEARPTVSPPRALPAVPGAATLPARAAELASLRPPRAGPEPPGHRPGLSAFLRPRPTRGPPAAA